MHRHWTEWGSGLRKLYLSFNENNYRRLTNYQDIFILNHGSYANYNSLQMAWQKQSGPVNYMVNYTYSKVLGIRDGNTNNAGTNGTVVNPFDLKANYGPLAYDHTQIANFTYIWNMPNFVHGNRFLGGAVNGWQLAGYTTYQSGAPLQASGALNFTYAGGLTVPVNGITDSGFPTAQQQHSLAEWFEIQFREPSHLVWHIPKRRRLCFDDSVNHL